MAALSRPGHLEETTKQIFAAEKEVLGGGSKAAEKQAIIDLTNDGINLAVRRTQENSTSSDLGSEIQDEPNAETASETVSSRSVKSIATFNLMVGCAAVGAGAERLDAQTKQTLISNLLKLSSVIVDGWTRDASKISVEMIADDLRQSSFYKKVVMSIESDSELQEFDKFVSYLSELIQFNIYQSPTGYVFHIFNEFGRHKVLAKSIVSAAVANGFEKILQGAWVADLSTSEGIKILRAAVKKSKPSDFFRMLLVNHLLVRVHWDHWDKNDRLKLLELASDVLKPTNLSIPKRKIKSLVKKSKPTSPR